MSNLDVIVADYDLITPFGAGVTPLMDALSAGQSAVKKIDRFKTGHFKTCNAAVIDALVPQADESILLMMLERLVRQNSLVVPPDTTIIFASTVGEIDLLERAVIAGGEKSAAGSLSETLCWLEDLLKVNTQGMVVSAACASSTAAIARACSLINSGRSESVLIVAGDIVSEFVFSGFSTLMALDDNQARPFDKNRGGLSIGEAAGYMLLMSTERAAEEQVRVLGRIAGSGMSNDATHMTAPSREGEGLSRAIKKSISSANVLPNDIAFIAAHGTGTHYNDAMEIKAFSSIFDEAVPIFSVKGAIGHTMGSAGLVQAMVAFESLKEKQVPGTVALQTPAEEAEGWVSTARQSFDKTYGLVVNAGFGGINVAVVIQL